MAKIVHVLGSVDRGGAEMVALELCRNLPADEYRQVFICLSGRKGSLSSDFTQAGAEIIPLGLRPVRTFSQRFRAELHHQGPDVLISHVSLASAWLLGLARLAGVRTRMARIHSDGDDHDQSWQRKLYRSVSRLVLALTATHVIAVTESSLAFAMGRADGIFRALGGKELVVPNGVDGAKFQPRTTDDDHLSRPLLYVGRASPEKNRRLLLPIWNRLCARGHSGRFAIVGSQETSDLMAEVPPTVDVLGDRSDVAQLMSRSGALILTSTREGLPTVVLEALASGIPVVASDLPGLREIQQHCPGLELVAVDADVDVWAAQVEKALNLSSAQRQEIRDAFTSSVFDLDQNLLTWRQLWTGTRT